MSSVSTIEGAPHLLRCDLGTENANLAFMQPFLRRHDTDCFAEFDSFRYGKSVSNQVCASISKTFRNAVSYGSISLLLYRELKHYGLS